MSGGGDTQQSTQQTTTQIPAWMDQAGQNTMGMATGVLANNGYNPLQIGAYNAAGAYGSMAPGALGQSYNVMSDNANYQPNTAWLTPLMGMLGGGGGMGGAGSFGMGGGGGGYQATYDPAEIATVDPALLQQVQARSVLDYDINDYMSPYTTGVIDAQLGDVERARMAQSNADRAAAIGAGAFGGSRSGVVQALTNAEYDRNSQTAAAQLRDRAYQQGMGLIGQDIAGATAADQFNSAQNLQTLLANAGFTNAGNQFNAGQQNQLDQAQIAAAAQRSASARSAMASMYGAQMGFRGQQLDAAATLAQLGLGADLNAATLRGNTAQQLAAFGQGGIDAMGGAGNEIYNQPMQDLSWYGGLLGQMPGANAGTSNTTTTTPTDSTNQWMQAATLAAMAYMGYSS